MKLLEETVRELKGEEIEDEGVDSVGHDGLSHQCATSGFDARLAIVLRSTGGSHCCTKTASEP